MRSAGPWRRRACERLERMGLSDPGVFEAGSSLAPLAGAVWMTRMAAGRVLQLGILLHGKEPTLDEIARWASERRDR